MLASHQQDQFSPYISGANSTGTYTYNNVLYRWHKITSSTTLEIAPGFMDFLVIAGGGGGGAGGGEVGGGSTIGGSGGGAGGLVWQTNIWVTGTSGGLECIVGSGGDRGVAAPQLDYDLTLKLFVLPLLKQYLDHQ